MPTESIFHGDRKQWFNDLADCLLRNTLNVQCEQSTFQDLCRILRIAGASVEEAYDMIGKLWPLPYTMPSALQSHVVREVNKLP